MVFCSVAPITIVKIFITLAQLIRLSRFRIGLIRRFVRNSGIRELVVRRRLRHDLQIDFDATPVWETVSLLLIERFVLL